MLRPSDAHLWVPCPLAGHVLTTGHYHGVPVNPDQTRTDDDKREGECAHWVGESVFNGSEAAATSLIGEQHPNGWIVDEDMATHTQNFVNYVRSFGDPIAVEMPIELFDLVRGRLDVTTIGNPEIVRVFELKYGWKIKDVKKLWSALCYGLAIASTRGAALEIHLYQPRPYHPDGPARVWSIGEDEIDAWMEWLRSRARDTLGSPDGKPGEQCLKCPARGGCQALRESGYACYEIAGQGNHMAVHTAADLSAELKFLDMAEKLIDARRSALRAEAYARITKGEFIPGWGKRQKLTNRKFTVSMDAVKLATGMEPYKQVAMSPAELERAGVPEVVMDVIARRQPAGWELTDKPEAIADAMFGKVEG